MRRTEILPNGCIIWLGSTNGRGYGKLLGDSDKLRVAHAVSYEYFVGEIPDGLMLDHLCRNRLCVNAAHLEPVTNQENAMRGNQRLAGHNAEKINCPAGHSYSGANLIVDKQGWRKCKACSNGRRRKRR